MLVGGIDLRLRAWPTKFGVWSRQSTSGAILYSWNMPAESDSPAACGSAMQNDRRQLKRNLRPSSVLVGKADPYIEALSTELFSNIAPRSMNGFHLDSYRLEQGLRHVRLAAL